LPVLQDPCCALRTWSWGGCERSQAHNIRTTAAAHPCLVQGSKQSELMTRRHECIVCVACMVSLSFSWRQPGGQFKPDMSQLRQQLHCCSSAQMHCIECVMISGFSASCHSGNVQIKSRTLLHTIPDKPTCCALCFVLHCSGVPCVGRVRRVSSKSWLHGRR
jgi:hypothetical protein